MIDKHWKRQQTDFKRELEHLKETINFLSDRTYTANLEFDHDQQQQIKKTIDAHIGILQLLGNKVNRLGLYDFDLVRNHNIPNMLIFLKRARDLFREGSYDDLLALPTTLLPIVEQKIQELANIITSIHEDSPQSALTIGSMFSHGRRQASEAEQNRRAPEGRIHAVRMLLTRAEMLQHRLSNAYLIDMHPRIMLQHIECYSVE